MTKAEMKRAAFAVCAKKPYESYILLYKDLGEQFNVDCKAINAFNERFDWILEQRLDENVDYSADEYSMNGLLEASILLSEACS